MFVDVSLPAGMFANGTDWQASGRWSDGNLIRFYEGQIKPIGGWRQLTSSAMTGKPREIVTWRDNSGGLKAGIGTESNLYVMTQSGTLTDITPTGYTAGRADAENGGGFGAGNYGNGVYGLPLTVTDALLDASVWSLDLYGENLIGVMSEDGIIYQWAPTDTLATAVTNAPEATAVVVTGERILIALGADNNPRKIQWADRDDITVWTPSASNDAGDLELQTSGKIQSGIRITEGALIFTDTDLWRLTFVGGEFIFSVEQVSDVSGSISHNAAVQTDGRVFWMGPQGFWQYNGFAQELQCDVADRIFTNLNRSQISKVTAFHNSAYGEVWWFYPDQDGTENNRYVAYSYREGHWTTGALERLAASDLSPFRFPLMTASDGHVYEHEVGFSHGTEQAYLVGGPLQMGTGDNVIYLHEYLPDTNTLGDMTLTLNSRYYPMGTETVSGPIAAAIKTDLRISGRQHAVRFDMASNTDWRIGVPRIRIKSGGRR
tara:strand:+ start:361 stop:1827 length:1467 start_codon:yes stop_codon:yes gene_type:complete